jgi:hypothetical protein
LVADLVVQQWQKERNARPASQPSVSNDLDARQQAAAERWATRQKNSPAPARQSAPRSPGPTLKTPDLELKRERDYDRGGPEEDLTVIVNGGFRPSGRLTRPAQPMPMLILKQSRLKKKKPTLIDLCVYLAGAAFPMERLFRDPIAPQCVNVNYRECAVALFGYCDAQRLALVVNEIVPLEERLP